MGCSAQTLAVAVNPPSVTIYPGQQNIPITITANSNLNVGPIGITLTGLPSGISARPLTLVAGEAGTLNLSASVSAGQEGFSNQLLGIPTSWTAPVTVQATAGSARSTSQLSLTISISNPAFAPAASAINLPIVNINTNGVPIVSKTTDVPGTITITSADSLTSYLPNGSDKDNTGTFHVHGNSTAQMPKLPYHVKLNTSLDLLNVMGLSCPYVTSNSAKPACDKSKSYILLANYDDKTLLRDWAASALANGIPIGNGYLNSPSNSPSPSGTSALMPWAPHSRFVELFLNGAYEGNYQLIEEVKVDSHRVNIDELSETDTAANQVTGGYLMEIDDRQDEAYDFTTPQGVDIGLIDPDFTPDPEVPEQTSYISNYVDTAENALFSSNFTDPVQGWRAWFDEASAINYYIVNDVMGNVDVFLSSTYLYKNDNNPLIYMGPIWDFDISSGNVNYAPIVNATVPWIVTESSWYGQWFTDPAFKADVVKQWNALKKNGVFTTWLASIEQEAQSLEQSQANNFGRWPMQGIEIWPNTEAAGSYDGEVAYFTNWLNLRIAYLDSLFNNKAPTSVTLGAIVPQQTERIPVRPLRNGASLTLTAQVSAGTGSSGVVSFLSNGVLLGTASLDGSGSARLIIENLPSGMNGLQAVYNGDDNNALSASAIRQVDIAAWAATTPGR
jgi:CotH kinase protein/Bacterial Ig-like domain (group 3)